MAPEFRAADREQERVLQHLESRARPVAISAITFWEIAVMVARGRLEIDEPLDESRTRRVSNYGIRNRLWVGLVDMLGVLWLQRRMTHPVVLAGRRPADPSFMNRPR